VPAFRNGPRNDRPRRAHRVEVPEAVRSAGSPAGVDDATAFEILVAQDDERSPEQWARLIFEGAPIALRWFVLIGWRVVLRLRLGPARTPAYVLGWRIVGTTASAFPSAEAITLQVRSKLITADKIVQVNRSRVTVTTLVRYERRTGRLIWMAVSPIHHLTEPLLLTRAARVGHC
jgi:hypothetical protein